MSCPLSLWTAFRFPLQSALSRREVVKGALWLLVPGIGWVLNMGHRIMMTHRMQHGLSAWPAWKDYPALLRHGLITFLGMVEYHAPAVICDWIAWHYSKPSLHVLAAALWILATIAVPGYMSHYCYTLDAREGFDPLRALRRVFQGGGAYWGTHGGSRCARLRFPSLVSLRSESGFFLRASGSGRSRDSLLQPCSRKGSA